MIGLTDIAHSSLFYRPNKSLKKVFYSSILRQLSVSFLSVFSGVYVYEIFSMYGFEHKQSLYFVLLFYLVMILSKLTTFGFSEVLSRKIGFEGTIKLSLLPFLILIILIVLAKTNPFLVILASFFWGINAALYWWGFHGYFTKSADSTHFGAGIGELEMLKVFVVVSAPLLGALLINTLGFNALYLAAGIIMLISTVFVMGTEHLVQKHNVTIADTYKLILSHKWVSLSYVSIGVEGYYHFIGWQLFLFFFFGGVLGLGSVLTISLLLSALFLLFIGKKIDEQNERVLIKAGSPIMSLSWFLRVLGGSASLFVIADSVRHFSEKMVSLPLTAISYKKGLEGGVARAVMFREITVNLGGLFAILLAFVLIYAGLGLKEGFVIISVVMFIPLISVLLKKL